MPRKGPSDQEPFNALLRQHASHVMSFARHLTINAADAEDLTQEVLIAAYCNLSSLSNQNRLRTWLFSIAVRRWREMQRKRYPTLPLEDEELLTFAQHYALPEREREQRALSSIALQQAIGRLSLPLREAFLLVVLEGFTHAEAAEVLDRSVGTIKWRVAEATQQIRRRLQEEDTVG